MEYYLSGSALKDIGSLPVYVRKRIIKKLDYFVLATNPLNFAEPIYDRSLGSYRFRIGDYRIIFDIDNHKIIILAIGHRKDIYR